MRVVAVSSFVQGDVLCVMGGCCWVCLANSAIRLGYQNNLNYKPVITSSHITLLFIFIILILMRYIVKYGIIMY